MGELRLYHRANKTISIIEVFPSHITVQRLSGWSGNVPQPVQTTLKKLLEYDVEVLEITNSALELSEQYLKREILTPKFRDDALHIALASLANVDVLVSWNFRHIVHYDKIRLFNAVNIENGLKSIDIYSPREVTSYEE